MSTIAKTMLAAGNNFSDDCKVAFDQVPTDPNQQVSSRKVLTIPDGPGDLLGMDTLLQLQLDNINEGCEKFSETVVDRTQLLDQLLG